MPGHEERETWSRKLDFLLSCVGYAVGLGNLWRFPYLCMRNGGGAFLIPYIIFLCFCGIPLFFLELVLGQYSRLSPLAIWGKICPLFKGIGYGSVMVCGIMCVYYNLILAWTIFYLVQSFTLEELPWASCDQPWNTDSCSLRKTSNYSMIPNATSIEAKNASDALNVNVTTPAEEFWHYRVLDLSNGIDDLGQFKWKLSLCLAGAWLLVFVCLFRGIQTSGKVKDDKISVVVFAKRESVVIIFISNDHGVLSRYLHFIGKRATITFVVYVTAVGPYVILVIFFIRGVTLDGAWEGIKFYIVPDFNKLRDFKVWIEACSQIFYSLGPAYGTLITMASYNRFNNNCYRDAIIIPIINCGTSIFAGFVIFSVIGFMAKQAGVDVAEVATAGPGLAFVVYPEALTQLPLSQLWAAIFFFMLLMIGLDTQFGMFETMISGFQDVFPKKLGTKTKKTLFTGFMCAVQFGLGLPLVMQGGIYVFQLLDWYSATFSLMVISLLECVVVTWIYGGRQVYKDIQEMTGSKPCLWWMICWYCITPGLLLMVLIFTLVKFSQPTYGDYIYPPWAVGLGWFIAVISLIPIPLLAVVKIIGSKGPIAQRMYDLFRPDPTYRLPADTNLGKGTLMPIMEPDESNTQLEDFKTAKI